MGLLYGRAGRLTAQNGGFRPGQGLDVFKNPAVAAVGKKHGVSAAQVALRWLVQQGVAVVTAADNAAYIKGEVHKVRPEFSNWPSSLTENPYQRPEVGLKFGPTLRFSPSIEDIAIFSFELSGDEMATLAAL